MEQSSGIDGRPPVLATLGGVEALLDSLDHDSAWQCSDAEVAEAVDAAYRLTTRVHAAALRMLAEADRRGLADAAGAPSLQAWLRARHPMRPAHAKRDVALARLIPAPRRPEQGTLGGEVRVEGVEAGAALTSGVISVEQAGCVATALQELPDDLPAAVRIAVEEALVAQAQLLDPEALTRFGHRVLEQVDPDAADRRLRKQLEREEREARRLRAGKRFADGHGNVFYKFRVPESDDAHIRPVLDVLSRPQPAGDTPDTRTAQQRLADAFVEGMRRVSLEGGLPAHGGDRPRVVITLSLSTLLGGRGAALDLDTGAQLSAEVARRLACDAQVIPAVLDGQGQVLDLGRAKRTFDGPARLAVVLRDRGCVHPGCDRPPRWCDVHHVVPWWAGGPTDRDNGVLLCGFHHGLYDDEVWRIRFAGDGIPEAIPPPWVDEHQRPARHHRFRATPYAPAGHTAA
jgi:hypothetical protein